MTKPRREFELRLRPLPDGRDGLGRDPIYRLRGVLKELGRRYGFQCTFIRELPVEPADGDDATETDEPTACPPTPAIAKARRAFAAWRDRCDESESENRT